MNKVTAVIPSLASEKTRPYLRLCVESLRATTDWDIVVVTNGTKSAEALNIDGITARLHTSEQGQCNAVNIGAQLAKGDYLFISNDDMYYTPGWNQKLDFKFPCFSPNLVEPTNNAGSAKPFLKCNGGFTIDEFNPKEINEFINKRINMSTPDPKKEVGFNFPFFIERKLWNMIEGYDTAYDPWGSNGDTDLQTKIELAGVIPMRIKDVLVYHFSNKSGTFQDHQDYWQKNWDYYNEKWGFNRDETMGDPWYCHNMIDYEKLKYKPKWMKTYGK